MKRLSDRFAECSQQVLVHQRLSSVTGKLSYENNNQDVDIHVEDFHYNTDEEFSFLWVYPEDYDDKFVELRKSFFDNLQGRPLTVISPLFPTIVVGYTTECDYKDRGGEEETAWSITIREVNNWDSKMSTKRYDYNGLSEVLRVETYPDGKIHDYITTFDLDCDKNDIATTTVLHMPYDPDLMAYWDPAGCHAPFMVEHMTGRSCSLGRVREITHTGYEIQVTRENIGWKLKQLRPASVLDYLRWKTSQGCCIHITGNG